MKPTDAAIARPEGYGMNFGSSIYWDADVKLNPPSYLKWIIDIHLSILLKSKLEELSLFFLR